MDKEKCQLIVKEKSGKVLWSSPVTNKRNCYAILRGNSNFEIMSGKIRVWGNNTADKQKGKGPYRLTLDTKGNIIVKNNQSQCAWALFGCPIPKKTLEAIKKAPARKQYKLIKNLMKKAAKRRNVLPTKQLPAAKGAPKIKNQLPKILKNKTPPAKKSTKKLLISKEQANKLKNLLKNEDPKAAKKAAKSLKGKVNPKQIKKLRKLINKGLNWNELRKIAMRKLKEKQRKATLRIKRRNRKAKTIKPKPIKTKRQLINKVKKLTWMQKVKLAVMRGEQPWKVKRMMQRLGNVRGNVRFWNKMTQMIRSKNWNEVARLVALPESKKRVEFARPKRWVTRGRYQRAYHSYITWYWRQTYRTYWARSCWRVWWWTRCRWYLRYQYYNYRYYYWTGYYYWKYVTYRSLE